MNHTWKTLAPLAVLLAAVTLGCSNDTGTGDSDGADVAASQREHGDEGEEREHEGGGEGRGEHGGEGEARGEHGGEGRGEHDRDAGGEHGEEGEESGTEFELADTYDEVRHGARLVLAYDKESNSFKGTVENTTTEILERVRVEVHLSNGKELGPTTPIDMEPGAKEDVQLTATSTDFDGWSAHPEVGSNEHGHGGEGGGEGEGEGEHGAEGEGEHSGEEG